MRVVALWVMTPYNLVGGYVSEENTDCSMNSKKLGNVCSL